MDATQLVILDQDTSPCTTNGNYLIAQVDFHAGTCGYHDQTIVEFTTQGVTMTRYHGTDAPKAIFLSCEAWECLKAAGLLWDAATKDDIAPHNPWDSIPPMHGPDWHEDPGDYEDMDFPIHRNWMQRQ